MYSDQGINIRVGRNVFINQNCTLSDIGGITIGDEVFIGPRVSLITSGHPVDPALRSLGRSRFERAEVGQPRRRFMTPGLTGLPSGGESQIRPFSYARKAITAPRRLGRSALETSASRHPGSVPMVGRSR